MRRTGSLGVIMGTLAAACLVAQGARAEVIECGALIVSVQSPSLCARAIGWQDWQPVVLSPCPTSGRPETGSIWKVFKINNDGEHFIRTLLRPNELRRMEVRGWSHDEGGLIQIWGPNLLTANGNQKWRLIPKGTGRFLLQVIDGGKCLTANGNEQQLVQRTCNADPSQLWSFRTVLNACDPTQE
jgi:hypothetical protein